MARPRESDQALTRVLYRDGFVFVFVSDIPLAINHSWTEV